MRARRRRNITNKKVNLKLENGETIGLMPDSVVENIIICNKNELVGKVLMIEDLTEVTRPVGKTQING